MTHFFLAVLFFGLTGTKILAASFDSTVSFNAENRVLSYYVPDNYDSSQAYRLMVCLHGLGDNSTNYRNALISSLNWPSIYPHTIFICPDGGSDTNKDFYQPAGDEAIIQVAIQNAMSHYHIDSQSVLLQGFSLGGRSALKYGLDHPQTFKALLLNTPAMQGIADVLNDSLASIQFDYGNAHLLPMFITVGENDQTYYYQIQTLINTLKKYNTPLQSVFVANLAHNIPGSAVTQKSYSFLVLNETAHIDADLFGFTSGNHFCSNPVAPVCFVRNNGDSIIQSLTISIHSGDQSAIQTWDGTILPNHYTSIPLSISLTGGEYLFSATITEVNHQAGDEDSLSNHQEQHISVADGPSGQTVMQGFDTNADSWVIKESGSLFEWYIDNEVKKSGTGSIASFNVPLLFYTRNYTESFSSPFINIKALAQKEFHFDIAYNYLRYTPPNVANQTDFADTLEILISTDCGQSFSTLYKKGGKELATASQPILNPLSIQACIFEPADNEWRTETIALTNYATAENAILTFNCISAMGGSMYIDNISLGGAFVSIKETSGFDSQIQLYPNPANNTLTINALKDQQATVSIFNTSGELVMTHSLSGTDHQFDTSQIPSGLYIVQIIDGERISTQKLLIQH